MNTYAGDWELPFGEAARMNRDGSETGRVARGAVDTSVRAARAARAPSQREIVAVALAGAGARGMTSIEVAAVMPLTRQGGPQVSNRAASRLGELWELGRVAVLREGGVCQIGVCQTHDKPLRVHRPMLTCARHGHPVRRDGAVVWVAL